MRYHFVCLCGYHATYLFQYRYKVTYSAVDCEDGETTGQAIGHFTFLGQSGVALLETDEILLVPNPQSLPVVTPRCLLEPVGKRYVITADLMDNSLDSDYLCFQVSTSEEVCNLTSSDTQSPAAVTAPSAENLALEIGNTESRAPSDPNALLEDSVDHTPPDESMMQTADKVQDPRIFLSGCSIVQLRS